MRKNINSKDVTKKDFEAALKEIKPSVSKETNAAYDSMIKKRAIASLSDYKKEIITSLRWFEENKESSFVSNGDGFVIISRSETKYGKMSYGLPGVRVELSVPEEV